MSEPPIVVQKYGGSSVADSAAIAKVAERVAATARAGKRVVVVVSAMGDSTDALLGLAAEVSKAPPRRELDMLLTAGERISMALLSMALQARGVDAISFTGSQSGILTNDAHAGARIIEVRPYRIQDELARDRVVIVAGFQGVSYKKEVTTLGRGGSDTTAVALAAALGAEYCELCSDVEGVYDGDPRVIEDAALIPTIGSSEMLALADSGARVLHRAAVDYARSHGIGLWARSSASSPVALDSGTLIRVDPPPLETRVLAVATDELRWLQGPLELLPTLLGSLAQVGLGPHELVQTERFDALFSIEDLHAWPAELVDKIDSVPPASSGLAAATQKAPLIQERGCFAVNVVGSAFDRAPLLLPEVLAAANGLQIAPLAVFASSQRLSLLVKDAEQARTLSRQLHRQLLAVAPGAGVGEGRVDPGTAQARREADPRPELSHEPEA